MPLPKGVYVVDGTEGQAATDPPQGGDYLLQPTVAPLGAGLPFTTHLLTVARVLPPQAAVNVDPWDDVPVTGQPSVVAVGVPAVLLKPTVTVAHDGGTRTFEVTPLRLNPDADVQPGDRVTDESSGAGYTVQWIQDRRDADGTIDHLVGELLAVRGEI